MIAPRRATGMVTYNRRPRSLWGNLSLALLQPGVFYQSFPLTRQWMWVAAVILILNGFSAVNQPAPADANTVTGTGNMPAQEMPMPPDMGGIPSSVDGGFIPPTDMGGVPGAGSAPNVSRTVMTALLAAGGVVLAWFIQAVILSEVSLINGARPSFGLNLQIAVWASVPLALMLLIQQIYFAAGGEPGLLGLSLLLETWSGFAALPAFSRAVLTTLFTNLTLFWLWSLILLYFGGRYVLNGRRSAVILVVIAWVIVSTFVPALSTLGRSEAPAAPEAGVQEQVFPMETMEAGALQNFPVEPGESDAGDTGSSVSLQPAAPGGNVQVVPLPRGSGDSE